MSFLCSNISLIERGALDPPGPIFDRCAQSRCHGILPDVIDLGGELLATLVITQAMIEVSFLPDHSVLVRVKMFPTTNHPAHCLIPAKGQQRMDVIRH